jgi:type I restriction enzyme S subunit
MSKWPKISLAELTAKRPICYGVLKPGEHHPSGVPLIRVTDIRNNYLETKKVYRISNELSESFKRSILKGGEVLLSIQGTVGRVALCPKEMAGANVSRTIAVIEPDERINRCYLRYWLLSEASNFKVGGSTRASFNIGDIRKLEVSAPPLPEQKGIVAILDEAFAGIDTAIANTQKNLVNAREVFKSYLDSVFSQQFMEMAERNLAEVCVNLDSKRVPITRSNRVPGDVPYYGATGIVDHVEDYIFDEDLLLVSEDGANLLARSYPIAFSVSGKTWVNNHAHVLRFERIESQRFVEYYLNSVSLEKYVSGMAQPKLNQRALNSIKIPFPSIEEQRVVVSKLDELADGNGQLSEVYEKKLIALAELKQSLLQKAFSGELTADRAGHEIEGAAI